jgi:hypothetical protein
MAVEQDFDQWKADNERLVLAGLQNIGPTPVDYDEVTLDAVRKRCIARFGERFGLHYFRGLIATFPERHKDLFPEIFEQVDSE